MKLNGINILKCLKNFQALFFYPSIITLRVNKGENEMNHKKYFLASVAALMAIGVFSTQQVKAAYSVVATRKVTRNAYIYNSTNKRTSYKNKKKLYKGQSVTTYGDGQTLKNGQKFYKISPTSNKYVKVANFKARPVVKTATAVIKPHADWLARTFNNKGNTVRKNLKPGTKLTVDRHEVTSFSDNFPAGMINDDGFYHIKGSNQWIMGSAVKVNKKIPLFDPEFENARTNYSLVRFKIYADVYNRQGEKLNADGVKVRKQANWFRADNLLYIWLPSENKAELFYHLIAKSFYTTSSTSDKLKVSDAYVKASDMKYFDGLKLKPSNTQAEAKAAAENKN